MFSREFSIYLFINPVYMITILVDAMKFDTNGNLGATLHGLKKENEAYEKVCYCNDLNGFLLRLMYCGGAQQSTRVEHSLKEGDPLWYARQENRNP